MNKVQIQQEFHCSEMFTWPPFSMAIRPNSSSKSQGEHPHDWNRVSSHSHPEEQQLGSHLQEKGVSLSVNCISQT